MKRLCALFAVPLALAGTWLWHVPILLFLLAAIPAPAQAAYQAAFGPYNIVDFGADPTGATDVAAIINSLVSNTPAGLAIAAPPGTYCVATPITLNKSVLFENYGTIKPCVQVVAATSMVNITASNVVVDCKGIGQFNGISSSYNLWQGVAAVGPTAPAAGVSGVISGGKISNCAFNNIAVGLSSATANLAAIYLQATSGFVVENDTITNVGLTAAFVNASGYGVYSQLNSDMLVDHVICTTVGYACVSHGASLRTTIRATTATRMTLFAFKGGFGNAYTVTSDFSPTVNQFSVANTNYAKAALATGFTVVDVTPNSFPLPRGYIKSVDDSHATTNGGYLIITLNGNLAAMPTVGDVFYQIDTGTRMLNDRIDTTGSDAIDENLVQDLTIDGLFGRNGGLLQLGGLNCPAVVSTPCSSAVESMVWIGADAVGGTSFANSQGLHITNFDIGDTYSGCVQLDASPTNAIVANGICRNSALATDSPAGITAVAAGIMLNSLSASGQGNNIILSNNIVTSAQGGAFFLSDAHFVTLSGNVTSTPTGVLIGSVTVLHANDNDISANGTLTLTYGVKIFYPGGAHASQLYFTNNNILLPTVGNFGGGTGYGVWDSDAGGVANAANVYATGNVILSGNTGGTFDTVYPACAGVMNCTAQALP
jgi:hypothetical protein